ncbi:sarcosine oxidase subunit alpha [Rhodopseudomonas julia]|uniref:Sarcosine oxidase subunit alpha n=1 Tax=Rhodopseudomonas julia TaxID=200617 RepID=A0ABU0C417_9BRAD|nr:sarcosine oxidase subunit alpha family protein [Rhodopseudomonas julia]MDQ0324425.1 sarcosine oxidase subunit alpha [Rhodopseudomonas julia]
MVGFRTDAPGTRIDRDKPLRFTFDGKPVEAFSGDTIASALLASGRAIVARSFKYHRPRGVFAAGSEEPNALVTTGVGGETEPNVQATTRLVSDGLVVSGQNAYPSVDRDLGAINQVFAPFFGAGFYYKTFMGPMKRSWMWYEPSIRAAAGMGRASLSPDPARYERANAFADLLVVGGGPAGLAAALTAGRVGARVLIADEGHVLGGAIDLDDARINGTPALDWAKEAADELDAMPNVRVLRQTNVWGYYDANVLAAFEDCSAGGLTRARHWRLQARQVVLATGSYERPIVFAGNDRPGVMLVSAALAYARRFGVMVGRQAVLFCNNDQAWLNAAALVEEGLQIAAIVDPREDLPAELTEPLEQTGARLLTGHVVIAAQGKKQVEKAVIMAADGSGETTTLECDTLLVSGGSNPVINLASQAGGAPTWNADIAAFVPGTQREAWVPAGAMIGAARLGEVLKQGAVAGQASCELLGLRCPLPSFKVDSRGGNLRASVEDGGLKPLFEVKAPAGRRFGKFDKAFVDLQHDVTAEDIRLAAREGFESPEHVKRYTTLGMANDQGKTSNVTGLAILAEAREVPMSEAGTTRFRPPFVPVPLGTLAGRARGAQMRPVRRSPLYATHVAAGAPMAASGLWMEPRAYPRPGEAAEKAALREATHVREAVGIADISSTGKIDVAGPDAAAFLDRVYTNLFSNLTTGQTRYGVMLREDGLIFAEGTAFRLSKDHFLLTTPAAKAETVVTHLEFLLAIAWPDLRVTVTSVTEHYAGIAVSGPKSRTLVSRVVEGRETDNRAFPYRDVHRATISDLPVIVARLSSSGEDGYEIYIGADHGVFLWKYLLEKGKDLDVSPYGMEAMDILRIEKGYPGAAEFDGRRSLEDFGMEKILSKKKNCVGRPLALREALTSQDRQQLVGLVALDGAIVQAGAHLVKGESAEKPGESEGHITSATYSPAMKSHIALALLRGGRERHEEVLYAADPLRGTHNRVRVVDPQFYDPDGSRPNG